MSRMEQVSDPYRIQFTPLSASNRGIVQTEQAATIEEQLHGFCCGKLEGKDVDVGTIIARHNKVFTEMFLGYF